MMHASSISALVPNVNWSSKLVKSGVELEHKHSMWRGSFVLQNNAQHFLVCYCYLKEI
jgi:hypothetical protein